MGGSFKYAVISDVHSNLEALRAVLNDIEKEKIKKVLFIGDVVGYGPDPVKCIELIRKRCIYSVAGNHDWAVIGYTPSDYFNYNARVAIEWTKEQLAEDDFKFLRSLSIVKVLEKEGVFLVHASPKEPDAWNYILSLYDAEINFQYFKERICLIGHSHVPFIIETLPSGEIVLHREEIEFKESCRYIINVGSVGQPRDGNPDAAYAIINDKYARIIRVRYDIEKTQKKMEKAGLPEFLIERLSKGI